MSTQQPSFNPMYFPPPPTSSKATSYSKKNLKLNFSKPRSGTETNSTSQQPEPILKKQIPPTKRTRRWILLFLLIISFTILILGVILAYCAALPHSDNAQAAQSAASPATSSPTATTTVSMVNVASAAAEATVVPPQRMLARDTPPAEPSSYPPRSVENAQAGDASDQATFGTSSAIAALTFYTATLPLLTLAHTATELLASLVRPQASQSTRLGDLLRFRSIDAQGVVSYRRTGTVLSFTVSALLCLGWLIMQMFWINCEVSTFPGGSEAVCPVQIRGHRMRGVSELSIGKVVLGFVIVLTYIGYCAFLIAKVGVCSKKGPATLGADGGRISRFRRRARFAKGEERKGDVESVVIRIDEKELR